MSLPEDLELAEEDAGLIIRKIFTSDFAEKDTERKP